MRRSFKVAPGVRVSASSRGLSSSFGPRAARVHVSTRGVGVSSGVGPFATYSRFGQSSRGGGRGAAASRSTGPTKASIAAYERELKAAQREADIDKVAALERHLVSVHAQSFPKAERVVLPPAEAVDPVPIGVQLETELGIPDLVAKIGGESPPIAPPPEPVDRYELMRTFRRRKRQGIPFWRLREQIEAAKEADREAEEEEAVETRERDAVRAAEQAKLDDSWRDLEQLRAAAAEQLPQRVQAEEAKRAAAREAEQQELDDGWAMLQANDPAVTLPTLEQAFADNEAPAAAIDCEGSRTTIVMQFSPPEAIVPERKPARTPTGKRTLKKRTKTEVNLLYLEALGSNVLATVKEAFAVAPGTELIQLLVIRRETDGKLAGQLTAIYVGELDRSGFEGASGSRDPARALTLAEESTLNLKGKTAQVAPLDLKTREDLRSLLSQLESSLQN
jgi:hypothetical protein